MTRPPLPAVLLYLLVASVALIAGCSRKVETPAGPAVTQAAVPPPPAEPAAGDAGQPPVAAQSAAPEPLEATAEAWAPEALEELLAPVALYPDVVLIQVLVASTNPQEVLDAGNWLIANPDLSGNSLDEAAQEAGFTPPIRALIQFPQVMDNMCLNLDWTEELGQAYVNDQAGVQGAVQRLREQAQSVGSLESSDKMTVKVEQQGAQQSVVIAPANPEVVYVPQYDPVAAYTPASTATTTTTTAAAAQEEGHSTGTLIATGLLAFGAGMIVNEVFDDDDDDWHNHYHYNWGGPMPYYPPYPYRPRYGGGFYPSNNYKRPNNYVRGNNVVVVNQNNNYYKRFDNNAAGRRARQTNSPITAARPNRSELRSLNAQAAKGPQRAAPAAATRGAYAGARQAKPATAGAAAARRTPKVQGSYAGARPKATPAAGQARAGSSSVKGSYTGAGPAASARPKKQAGSRPVAKDRGYAQSGSKASARPAPKPAARPAPKPAAATQQSTRAPKTQAARKSSGGTAFSGARSGNNARQASKRGRDSMAKTNKNRNAKQVRRKG